jgi:penicillin-binding protein 2A
VEIDVGRIERRQQAKRQWQFSDRVKSFNWKVLLLISIVMTLFGLLLFNILVWSSDVSKLSTPEPRPTFIYDQKGEIASKISQSKIEGVSIEEIPQNMINAVISTEDQRFYKHGGINYFGIAKALIKNLFSGEIVAGEI